MVLCLDGVFQCTERDEFSYQEVLQRFLVYYVSHSEGEMCVLTCLLAPSV